MKWQGIKLNVSKAKNWVIVFSYLYHLRIYDPVYGRKKIHISSHPTVGPGQLGQRKCLQNHVLTTAHPKVKLQK